METEKSLPAQGAHSPAAVWPLQAEPVLPPERAEHVAVSAVRGAWRFSPGNALFEDHFPGAPRVPGTLVIEAMRAEAEARFPGWRVAGVRRFRFRHFVEPGDYACALELRPEAGAIRCALLSGERRMAEGTLLVVPLAPSEES